MNVKRDLCLHAIAVVAALVLFYCMLDTPVRSQSEGPLGHRCGAYTHVDGAQARSAGQETGRR